MVHDHSGFAEYGCQACELAVGEEVQDAIDLLEEHGYKVVRAWSTDRDELTPADDIAHEPSEECPCGPTPLFVDGGIVYTHHSLDNREAVE